MAEDPRARVREMIRDKTRLDEAHAEDLEIGIYNWCIDFCDTKKIFKSWKNNRFSSIYLEKARSILSNLDPEGYLRNAGLLDRIKEKKCLPHEVPFMKPDEMCPERWKEVTEAFFKKYEHAYENKTEAMSSDYKCGKCKQRRVVYQEIFSRSADEAGVIHFACLSCGNRWKIG